MPEVRKTACEAGCDTMREIGEGICKRCKKAVVAEVATKEEINQSLIDAAEGARELTLQRIDSLDAHHHLLVMSYVGGEFEKRNYPSPFTPIGRASLIFLMIEAIEIMVPKEHRPWLDESH